MVVRGRRLVTLEEERFGTLIEGGGVYRGGGGGLRLGYRGVRIW